MKNGLEYINGQLCVDGFSLEDIADKYGTPVYVYSEEKLNANYNAYRQAFSNTECMICYAVKANYNGAIIRMFSDMGAGADVVSGGELFMALRAGIKPEKIVFSGVSKTRKEIGQALQAGIALINIESEQELEVINEVAAQEGVKADVSFRINPDIDPKTHPKIATGLKESKFGIQIDRALKVYERAADMANINVKGVHLHIGSQITDISPFILAAEAACGFADKLAGIGIELEFIDIGGGLGIAYEDIKVPAPADISDALSGILAGRSEKLILEPGRSLVGNTGFLVTRINYVKEGVGKNFVIVDAGFNDLIRPAMYGSYHEIIPVLPDGGVTMTADVAGPICETGDLIAADREIEGVLQDNLLCVCDSGAYGFSMSSNYNSRPRAPEVLIKKDGPVLIRKRESYEDLIDKEV